MNILVTGSKGVIGKKLTNELLIRGHNVFGIDLFHAPGEYGFIQRMGAEDYYCRCDIGEYRQLERIFTRQFDIVYNCAAEFGRWNGEDYYEQVWKSNVIGLKNLLRIQEKYNFKLVHFSSSEIYGDYPGVMAENITEDTEIKQLNDYALSKWTNETQILNSITLFKTETVIVRLFNTYGPGEYYHPYRSVNCKFCYHALHDLPITVYRGYYRTSTYIDDCINALANIAGNFISGRIYNIGSSQYHSIEQLAEIIWKYTDASADLIDYVNSEVLTTKIKQVDNSLSVKELGFKETVSLKQGVHETIDWMKEYYKV